MNIKLAISTCPNDTFIFYALLNGGIHLDNLSFDAVFTDIKDLNQLALRGEPDLVKISYAIYPHVGKDYQLLTAGSALGFGVGPLVVSKKKVYPDEIQHAKIGIPGETTTANFLLSMAYPDANNKKVYLFSEIEEAIMDNEIDVGVLIHEGRFTYAEKGLRKIADLGEFWEKTTEHPIPLGGIAVKRDLDNDLKLRLNGLIAQSINYSKENPHLAMPFIKEYAQEMQEKVMANHINLYVNDYSIDLGTKGRNAVERMFQEASKMDIYKNSTLMEPYFVV